MFVYNKGFFGLCGFGLQTFTCFLLCQKLKTIHLLRSFLNGSFILYFSLTSEYLKNLFFLTHITACVTLLYVLPLPKPPVNNAVVSYY